MLCKDTTIKEEEAEKFRAMKMIKRSKLVAGGSSSSIIKELEVLKKLNHPNIVRLYEVIDDPLQNKIILIM